MKEVLRYLFLAAVATTSTRLKLYTSLPATTGPEYLAFLFKK